MESGFYKNLLEKLVTAEYVYNFVHLRPDKINTAILLLRCICAFVARQDELE